MNKISKALVNGLALEALPEFIAVASVCLGGSLDHFSGAVLVLLHLPAILISPALGFHEQSTIPGVLVMVILQTLFYSALWLLYYSWNSDRT